MKHIDEYRDAKIARALLAALERKVTRPWVLMEICGGQTHTLMRYGIDTLLPSQIELVHGPGCPVCVTPLEVIDKAIAIASQPDVIFVLVRRHAARAGLGSDLFESKPRAATCASPIRRMEAIKIARANPDRQVVFFGMGFETTAPANAMPVWQARRRG